MSKRNKNHKTHTTEAFRKLPPDNIGIGFRPGQYGNNKLKGNRNQKSKRKMRTHYGMASDTMQQPFEPVGGEQKIGMRQHLTTAQRMERTHNSQIARETKRRERVLCR